MMAAPNWVNRTMWTGDNLPVLRGLNSESIDLVYLDPPFNSNQNYAAPIGSKAAGAAFKDTWALSDVDEAWHGEIAEREPSVYAAIDAAGIVHGPGMKSYLIMMAVRLLELRRVLKPTGSIYLHCDPTANSYLRLLCDAVFGPTCLNNEIVWCYRGGGVPKGAFSRKHDTIYWYGKTKDVLFNVDDVRIDYSADSTERLKYTARSFRQSGTYDNYVPNPKGKHPEDWWPMQPIMPSSKERTGYPTQKPLALLDRIIQASTAQGDFVLDPFAGCATACVSAESLHRQWLGIDLSPLAARLVESRLREQFGVFAEIHHRTDVPRRTDLGTLPNYRTHRHTLYGRQEGHCGGCRVLFPFRNLTVDHVVPQSKGGTDALDNLQLLCGACNSTKGAGTQAALVAVLWKRGIIST